MSTENCLYDVLKKEIEVNNIGDYFNEMDRKEIEYLKSWKGEKDKMYFCYLGMGGVDCWVVDKYKSFKDVMKDDLNSGWEDYYNEKLFDNVLFIDDGFYIKVV